MKETLKEKAERIKEETAREEEAAQGAKFLNNVYALVDKGEENIFLARTLFWLLKESRNHPGLSLREMARIYKEVFAGAEIKAFIKELK